MIFWILFSHFVCHSWSVPMMKITVLIFLSGSTCTIGGWLNTFLPHCTGSLDQIINIQSHSGKGPQCTHIPGGLLFSSLQLATGTSCIPLKLDIFLSQTLQRLNHGHSYWQLWLLCVMYCCLSSCPLCCCLCAHCAVVCVPIVLLSVPNNVGSGTKHGTMVCSYHVVVMLCCYHDVLSCVAALPCCCLRSLFM